MAGDEQKSGSEVATETSGGYDYFGIKPSEPEAAKADPDKQSSDKASDDPSKKSESTSDDGSGKPGDQGKEAAGAEKKDDSTEKKDGKKAGEKLWAGKYKNPEALELGYANANGQLATMGAENKTLRDKVTDLEAKLAAKKEPEGDKNPADFDSAVDIFGKYLNPEKREAMESALGVETTQILADLVNSLGKETSNQQQQIEKRFSDAEKMEEFHQAQAEVYASYPDMQGMEPDIEAFGKELPDILQDQKKLLLLTRDIVRGRKIDQIVDTLIAAKLPGLIEDGVKKVLAGGTVAGGTGSGAGTREFTDGEKYFGLDKNPKK